MVSYLHSLSRQLREPFRNQMERAGYLSGETPGIRVLWLGVCRHAPKYRVTQLECSKFVGLVLRMIWAAQDSNNSHTLTTPLYCMFFLVSNRSFACLCQVNWFSKIIGPIFSRTPLW